MDQENRVVVLIDMDCFYCQVEEKLNPELRGKPIAVVQYNPWKGGGIIAVNYVARAMGVTRHMRGDEAKEKCPEIQLPSVPCQRGKADITKYRDAGKDVAMVLQKFTTLLERASIDEAYLDITAPVQERLKSLNVDSITTGMIPNTYALGYDSVDELLADIHTGGSDSIDFDYEHAKRLLIGAVIVSEIRAAVFEGTGYRCSAGISHNKILAKLVCGMNKPNKQTVLPKHSIDILYKTLSIKKVKHLGGKFGDTVCELLKINKMAELQMFSEKELQARFDEKNGTWLYNIARGVDLEPVQARFNPKSIGCCKQFRGKSALVHLESLRKWLKDLGDEIEDRLEKDALENSRTPKQMVVSYSLQLADMKDSSSSRSYNFVADDDLCGELFSTKALEMIMENAEGCKPKDGELNRRLKAPITFLGISVGKFVDQSETKKTKKIVDYFGVGSSKGVIDKHKDGTNRLDTADSLDKKDNNGKQYLMQKFFQVTDTVTKSTNKAGSLVSQQKPVEENSGPVDSFFVKMLNDKSDTNNSANSGSKVINASSLRPATPVCDIIKCGDDSNDTEYSGSTINMEINKSMALFEDDPEDVARISNFRQLLNSTIIKDGTETEPEDNAIKVDVENIGNETFECSECGNIVPVKLFEEHADYHLALRLRDEERHEVRKETSIKKITKYVKMKFSEDQNKRNESVSSIANFFTKVDVSVHTEICSECGKKVSLEKFAEHLDFHEAQKLSRELNKKPSKTAVALNCSSVKRKRKSSSPVKIKKVPCKSIDSFFR